MTAIIQTILVMIILATMVMVLLSIGKLARGNQFEDPTKTTSLKREVEEDNKVLSHNSAFDYLIVRREPRERHSKKHSSHLL